MPPALKRCAAILRFAIAPLVVWAIYLLKGNIWFMAYPAIVSFAFFAAFLVSLARTPLVEVFARRIEGTLDAAGVAYCRKATVAWTIFLGVHFAVTVATVFMPLKAWAVYNGFIAYTLIGAMFAGEFIARKVARRG